MPKLSIIIPTFNSEDTIRRCLNSIRIQTLPDYEIVIQDGHSSDETLEIIKDFERENLGITVKTAVEPDQGPYDAMNKGTRRSQGEWLYFLGSDDELYDETVLNKTLNSPEAANGDVLYGNAMIVGYGGWVPDGTIYGGSFDLTRLLAMNICHQAIFYKAEFARAVGEYNIEYPLLADWDFNLRCWAKGQFSYVDRVIAKYHLGGISNTSKPDCQFEAHMTENVMRYFNLSPEDPLINSPSYYVRNVVEPRRRASRITPARVLGALARRLGFARRASGR